MNYIYKLFSKYFNKYKQNVLNRISGLVRVTDTEVLEVSLDELFKILDIISGRQTTELYIPKYNKFPSSKDFNILLEKMDVDFDVLFNSSKIVVTDAQNVVNFDVTQRIGIINLLSKTQGNVFQSYVLSKKGINGNIIIKEDFKTDDKKTLLSANSNNVDIDTDLNILTLKKKNNKPILNNTVIDTRNVDVAFAEQQDINYKLYPNNFDLKLGSFWNTKSSGAHFNKNLNPEQYRQNITSGYKNPNATKKSHSVELPSSSISWLPKGPGYIASPKIDSCQFESVITYDPDKNLETKIENKFSESEDIPKNSIFIDRQISINGKYISTLDTYPNSKIIIKIPFEENATLSNGLYITLNPNDHNELPNLNANESYIISTKNEKVGIYSVSNDTKEDTNITDKLYSVTFHKPIIPAMIKLVFEYDKISGWAQVQYWMSNWELEILKSLDINVYVDEEENPDTVHVDFNRKVNILIDDISDDISERNKALSLVISEGVE